MSKYIGRKLSKSMSKISGRSCHRTVQTPLVPQRLGGGLGKTTWRSKHVFKAGDVGDTKGFKKSTVGNVNL